VRKRQAQIKYTFYKEAPHINAILSMLSKKLLNLILQKITQLHIFEKSSGRLCTKKLTQLKILWIYICFILGNTGDRNMLWKQTKYLAV